MNAPEQIPLRTAVVFVVFNRPDCTARSLAAIRAARPRRLYVIADGPRPGHAGEAALCAEVRARVERGVDWPCEVIRDYAPGNLGCARRVSSGLDAVFTRESEAIILEDDCVPDPTFFPFCAGLLARLATEAQVGSISGSNFQGREAGGDASYYFSRYPHCWGWATWSRAWKVYDHAMKDWPEARRTGWLRRKFERRREADYWERIFDRVYSGEIDSWAYRWTFASWRHDFLAVVPRVNLVENIGFGDTATHTRRDQPGGRPKLGTLPEWSRHPARIERHGPADRHTYAHHFDPPLWLRVWRKFPRGKVSP
jgi:hypothetical protein